ncbi:hypothetical protein OROHE_020821 [Orobanche hederae]
MTNATRNSSDTSPELFGVLLVCHLSICLQFVVNVMWYYPSKARECCF